MKRTWDMYKLKNLIHVVSSFLWRFQSEDYESCLTTNESEESVYKFYSARLSSDWSEWSACTKTCDGGISIRFKECIDGIIDQSEACSSDDAIEKKFCSMQSCGEAQLKVDY